MINLEHLFEILDDDIVPIIEKLDGMSLEDTLIKEPAAVKTLKAEVSRDLLYLADRFAYLEAEVRSCYWQYKGRS